MKIKTSKGIKEVNEVFPDFGGFKNYVLNLIQESLHRTVIYFNSPSSKLSSIRML